MESTQLTPVRPVKPVAPWLGGKRNLAKRLIALIDATPHDFYGEVFVGQGGVFFRRGFKPRGEAINDFNRDVYNLFRVLQEHYLPFVELMRWTLTSRAEFERLAAIDPATQTDMQRAARFLFLQRLAFGGRPTGQTFGVTRQGPGRFDITRLQVLLDDVRDRLADVRIECLDFEAFIRRYDRPGALFFLDPPYVGGEADYGKGMFCRADYERLRGVLADLSGRFILTLNDVPLVRELFASFQIEPVRHFYQVSGAPTEARELIITGGRG